MLLLCAQWRRRDTERDGESLRVKRSAVPRTNCSVFPTEGFLRPGTQARQFGRKLKALDAFFV